MKKPPCLAVGDTVGVCAPAGVVREENIRASLKYFEQWKLNVEIAPHTFDGHYMYAASDANRLADLQFFLDKPSVKAIFCARGGYGSNRIVDRLDFTKFRDNPSWLVGFSDITTIHNHLHSHLNVASVHGTMPNSFSSVTDCSMKSLEKVLFDGKIAYHFQGCSLDREGESQAIICGGNLAILCSHLGTDNDIDTNQKILFIEDVGESHYKIDRMIFQLKKAGKLENLAGLLVGAFSSMADESSRFGKTVNEIILEATSEYSYPVAFNIPAGHIDNNHSLILGARCRMSCNTKITNISME